MKTKVTEVDIPQEYPCLKINQESGNVWLMRSGRIGTLIHHCTGAYNVGDTSNSLAVTSMTIFNGTVTLEN